MAKTALTSLQNVAQYSDLSAIVTDLVSFIKGQDTNVTNAYKALVGELGNKSEAEGETPAVKHTVKSYVDAAVAAANGDITTLTGKVDTLIGEDASKSVRTIAAEETAKVVASAPEAFDTLKEIADWIGSGEDIKGTTAATMLADITTLKGGETVEGSVKKALKDAKDYTDTLANGAVKSNTEAIAAINNETTGILKTAKDYTDALSNGAVKTNTEAIAAINHETTGILAQAKGYADGLAGNYDENGAAAAVQGATENTVKDVEDAINGFSYMSAEQLAAIKALIA